METTPPHLFPPVSKPTNGLNAPQMQPSHRLPHLALLKWVNLHTFGILPEDDDRVQVLADFFRISLLSKPATATGTPEIEARMGRYVVNESLSPEDRDLANIFLSMGYMQVLPFKQEGQRNIKNLFRFASGVREDHFYYLRSLFEEASNMPGSGVRNRGKRVTLDTTYSNNTRESKDLATNSVIEVIEKTGRADINIQNRGQDIRITSSIEQKQKLPSKKPAAVKYVRTKTRYSYDYEYMGFDLTHVKSQKDPKPTYEIELEVRDVGYLLKYTNDPLAFTKLVLRFISNLQSLYHILSQKYPEQFGNIIENHYKGVYGNEAPMPSVGGYLGCMAYRKSLQEKEAIEEHKK